MKRRDKNKSAVDLKEVSRSVTVRSVIDTDTDQISNKLITNVRLSPDVNPPFAPGFASVFLRFILLFLIVVALFHAVSGREVFITFSSFLEAIADAPKLDTSWIKGVSVGLSDWGIFNFLRGFVQSLISIVQMSLYLAVGTGQIIVFIGYFFSVFFMV